MCEYACTCVYQAAGVCLQSFQRECSNELVQFERKRSHFNQINGQADRRDTAARNGEKTRL